MIHGVAWLLVSAAAGYWVLQQAEEQKGGLQTLGRWLGITIIAVSVVGTGLKVYKLSQICKQMLAQGICPMGDGVKAPAPSSR